MTRERGELVVLESVPAVAQRVADHFARVCDEAVAARGRFNVALSGGSSPRAVYELLSESPFDPLAWDDVHFFFGDERCVPPDDDQSNFKMARATLLEPRRIAAHRIFRMMGEDDPATAARSYAETLRRELGSVPVLDLILLGMGPDGHTASLFPGTDPRTGEEALVRAPYVPKLSAFRITLTPLAINAARDVAIEICGAEKAAVLERVLEGPFEPVNYPIQAVAPASGKLTWFLDRAAAAKLGGV